MWIFLHIVDFMHGFFVPLMDLTGCCRSSFLVVAALNGTVGFVHYETHSTIVRPSEGCPKCPIRPKFSDFQQSEGKPKHADILHVRLCLRLYFGYDGMCVFGQADVN